MRVDEIDLIGNFSINGSNGTEGQIVGVTGGQFSWFTVSGLGGGGGAGPQGPTGSGSLPIPSGQILFGRVGGVTSSSKLTFNNSSTGKSFNHRDSGTDALPINPSHISSFGANDSTMNNSFASSTLGGNGFFNFNSYGVMSASQQSQIGYNTAGYFNGQSAILGSKFACTSCTTDSSIISNQYGYLYMSYRSVILGGCRSMIKWSTNSSIISSDGSTYYNKVYCSFNTSIIGGKHNCIVNSGASNYNSVILGGRGTRIDAANNSVIVGGCDSSGDNSGNFVLCKPNSVILGGVDKISGSNTYGTFWDCSTFFGCGCAIITNHLKLQLYENTISLGTPTTPAGVFLHQCETGKGNYLSFFTNAQNKICICL